MNRKRLALMALFGGLSTVLAGCPALMNVPFNPDQFTDYPGESTGSESPGTVYEGESTSGGSAFTASEQALYDEGFDEGFAVDEEYWQGYADSLDTKDGGTIYYTGSEIPYVEWPPYDAGYWDGIWFAYNDGYFVAYDFAFTIGFSEGYASAYAPDWFDFLAGDEHVEWLDGGWSDGYNDGFSEGRMLGATDYEQGLAFDWLDAMLWYREGNDVYIEELDLGTGEFGPVYLYEYGTDPYDLFEGKKAGAIRGHGQPRGGVRNLGLSKAAGGEVDYRALPQAQRDALDQAPDSSPRSGEALELGTTWLERVEAYLNARQNKVLSKQQR